MVKERELWAQMEQEAIDKLVSEGYEVITDIDKGPFIEATQPVRDQFGEKYADIIARIAAFAPEG